MDCYKKFIQNQDTLETLNLVDELLIKQHKKVISIEDTISEIDNVIKEYQIEADKENKINARKPVLDKKKQELEEEFGS